MPSKSRTSQSERKSTIASPKSPRKSQPIRKSTIASRKSPRKQTNASHMRERGARIKKTLKEMIHSINKEQSERKSTMASPKSPRKSQSERNSTMAKSPRKSQSKRKSTIAKSPRKSQPKRKSTIVPRKSPRKQTNASHIKKAWEESIDFDNKKRVQNVKKTMQGINKRAAQR